METSGNNDQQKQKMYCPYCESEIQIIINSNSKKEFEWQKALILVNHLTDRVGKKIDKKIQFAVAALIVHGFPTENYCGGHIKINKVKYPWTRINVLLGLDEKENKNNKELIFNNCQFQQKMLMLLEEFYNNRQTPFDARLKLFSGNTSFIIASTGADISALLSFKEQVKKLKLYRQEMDDFAQFLIEKYFQGEVL